MGQIAGLQTHWHTLAYTTAYLNVIINAPESPRPGPAARRAGLSADRKELINRALMTTAPSPVGSVLPAPVIEKYQRGRMGVR